MTTEDSPPSQSRFAQDLLPWIIGTVAVVIYLTTLNHWVTLNSIPLTAKVVGWDWQPMVVNPALFLATLPFRWLPVSWVPPALNAGTAVCAALTLALLARSVSLLPHDRIGAEEYLADNEHSLLLQPDGWVPPVLATLACGLQMTFWEHAISATGEMLDLLLFAYLVRCLLEYRLDKKRSWLGRAALAWGVAVANNWGMLCFLPCLVLVVIGFRLLQFFKHESLRTRMSWARCSQFLQPRLLLGLGLLGLAGLSLFLLLPLVQALSPDPPLSFGKALRTQAGFYGSGIQHCYNQFLKNNREVGLLLALTSLLPVLVMSVRWRRFSTDDRSAFGLGSVIFLISYAGLLIVCLWAAFDPFYSPFQISRRIGFPLPFLLLYYLSALSIGYYSGFLLLMFRAGSGHDQPGPGPLQQVLQWALPKLVYLLTALAPVGLVYKNLPVIQELNQPQLRQYGELAAQSLPPEGGIIFSDEPFRLRVLQAALAAGEGKHELYLPVELQSLPSPRYQRLLRRKYLQRWPAPPAATRSRPSSLAQPQTNAAGTLEEQIQLLIHLAQTNRLCCLHPTFGSVFELFYLEPRGLVYEMKRYPTNAFHTPPLPPAVLTNDEAFWTRTIETVTGPLQARIAGFEQPQRGLRKELMDFAHLEVPAPFQPKVVARWYAIALNAWGVTLQRNGRLREAARCLEWAQNLNPRNLAAGINLQCNSNLQAGRKLTVAQSSALEELTGRHHNVAQLAAEDGPVDDPAFCFQLGLVFAQNGLFRQSSQQFDRVITLASGNSRARLKPGGLSNLGDMRGKTFTLLDEICADPGLQPLAPAAKEEMNSLEADAAFHDLRLAHQRLKVNPDDISARVIEGISYIRLGACSNAIPPLTRILALTNSPAALFNRATAYLCISNLDAAQTDYLKLRQAWPEAAASLAQRFPILLGPR